MQARGGQPDEAVAGPDGRTVDNLLVIHHPHHESGQIILAVFIEARQLGRLAADEGHLGLAAALGHPGKHCQDDLLVQPLLGQVVEEEERPGPLDDDVVDAHGHQIDAHRVVTAGQEGDLELCPHAVNRRDQDRLLDLGQIQGEKPSETADVGDDARGEGLLGQGFYAFHQPVGRVDIDTGFGVAVFLFSHSGPPPACWRTKCVSLFNPSRPTSQRGYKYKASSLVPLTLLSLLCRITLSLYQILQGAVSWLRSSGLF